MENATKIRRKYLEALEEDDFEVLPGATCVIAFLRTYASFLKLDADALVDAYKNTHAAARIEGPPPVVVRQDVTNGRRSRTSAERLKKRVRRQQSGYALAAVIAIIVVGLLAWFGTGRGQEAASIEADNITTSTLTTTAPLGMITGGEDDGTGDGAVDGEDGATVSTSPEDQTTGAGTTQQDGDNTESGGDNAPPDSDGEAISLVVSVNDGSCWLVVREDSENGAEVFAGTLSAGGKQTFDSATRYWMRVGDPEVLTVSVGGEAYSLSAPAGAFVVTAAGVERAE